MMVVVVAIEMTLDVSSKKNYLLVLPGNALFHYFVFASKIFHHHVHLAPSANISSLS
jgi:hypothetical protein